jgi:hypothetical protein
MVSTLRYFNLHHNAKDGVVVGSLKRMDRVGNAT